MANYAVYKNKNGKLYAPHKNEETGEWKSTPVVGQKAFDAFNKAEIKESSTGRCYRVLDLKEWKTQKGIDVLVYNG